MIFDIKFKEKQNKHLLYCLNKLPFVLKQKIISYLDVNPYDAINEIRIHKNSNLALIADSKNIKTDIFIDETTINEIFEALCDGSIYAHIETIKQGYISLGNGIRAGICGRASFEKNDICGICEINSINIRIPHNIENASHFLFSFLKESNFNKSVIIYSSPGVGKTTILRDLICKLSNSKDAIRYAVIDSRNEITGCINDIDNADIYVSYPKGLAIELATKNMTPSLIICDEISSYEEAEQVLNSINSGVKLIATTHADSYEELTNKAILSRLFNGKFFDYALGVKREYGSKKYEFTLTEIK